MALGCTVQRDWFNSQLQLHRVQVRFATEAFLQNKKEQEVKWFRGSDSRNDPKVVVNIAVWEIERV